MKCKLCGKLSGISRVCIVCRTAIYDAAIRNALPQLLAHIESQDKRLSVLVEALEKGNLNGTL